MDHRNETSLAEEIRVCTRQFRPKTREIWERYAPEEYWYGELFVRTHQSLTGKGDLPISTAVGVELFCAYGLVRELPPDGPDNGVPECDSETLLAGDRFLSTSFERISSEHGEAEPLQQAIGTVSNATRRLSDRLASDGGFGTTGPEGTEESAPVVTGAVTGQLAVNLARILSGTEYEADATALTRAGSSIGIAVVRLGHSSPDSRIVMDTDDGGHPSDKSLETSIRERIEAARRQFGSAYETVPPSLATYLDRIASKANALPE
ncbi:hypothetical protein [Halalkaliarchaeum desulfuricum]|uniref:hypothetical protein n=1 Tax=Halalkaliarchaeum desulfuricum TaxID=2055893 RepID=UPI000E6B83C5|nr:hypothetical protein [Halalkaliarchaeum desulfuricum]